jgi:maltooligosyltrehalose trehalohydrolase
VVYNHFGPTAITCTSTPGFFREDAHTPWGAGIDFDRREVRDFFLENALMWLLEYRFDGLRLDAVHAIDNPGFLQNWLSGCVSKSTPAGMSGWCWKTNSTRPACSGTTSTRSGTTTATTSCTSC